MLSERKSFLCREWPWFLGAMALTAALTALNIGYFAFPSRDSIYFSEVIGEYAREFDFSVLHRDFPLRALPYAWIFVVALPVRLGMDVGAAAVAVNLLSLWCSGAVFFLMARRMHLRRRFARIGMFMIMMHPTLLKLAPQVQRDLFYFCGVMLTMGCFGIFAYRKNDWLPAAMGGLLTAFFAFVRFEALELLALPWAFFICSGRDGLRAVLYDLAGFLVGVGAFVCVFRLFGMFGIYSARIGQLVKLCWAHL